MIKELLKTNIGRLRIIGFFEGVSLLVLIFIGMPMKYYFDQPAAVKTIGPIHGVLFLLFVFYTLIVAVNKEWKFFTTFKVLISSFIPFGTFWVDKTILKKA